MDAAAAIGGVEAGLAQGTETISFAPVWIRDTQDKDRRLYAKP